MKFQLNQTTERKIQKKNLINLNESEFCEVSQKYLSNRFLKFQLSILKNKKVFYLKKLSNSSTISKQKGFVYRPNFQWRFWYYETTKNVKLSAEVFALLDFKTSLRCLKSNDSNWKVGIAFRRFDFHNLKTCTYINTQFVFMS